MSGLSEAMVKLRKEKGLSQQELAEATGLTRSAIGMYEIGQREPDVKTLQMLADFYKVDMDTMTGREPAPTKLREMLSENGMHILLDADYDLPPEHLQEIIAFIEEKQKEYGR